MFIYACSITVCALGFNELLESIFCRLIVGGSIFPAKSCRDTSGSGSWLVRGQVITVDETKLSNPIHSTFKALVMCCAVRCSCGEELGPYC